VPAEREVGGDPSWWSYGGSAVDQAVRETLDARFGNDSREVNQHALRNGYLGTVQGAGQTIVVVADPDLVDAAPLERELQKVAAKALKPYKNKAADVRVRVLAGCRSSAELADAGDAIRAATFGGREVPLVLAVDAHTSTLHVSLADLAAADELRTRFGDLVTVRTFDVPGRPAADPSCVIPEGDRTKRAWLSKGGGSKVTRVVTDLLAERFGDGGGKTGPRNVDLRNGLFGLALNYVDHEVVVVVDPALVDIPALNRDLQQAAAKALAGRADPDVTVRVHPSCHSSADLLKAYDVIFDFDRRPFGISTGGRDTYSAAWKIGVRDESVGKALEGWLGDLVRIRCCPVVTLS
jgi:hypothetical protein